jgi:hypothetical protein
LWSLVPDDLSALLGFDPSSSFGIETSDVVLMAEGSLLVEFFHATLEFSLSLGLIVIVTFLHFDLLSQI